jgi:hypothetical protein
MKSIVTRSQSIFIKVIFFRYSIYVISVSRIFNTLIYILTLLMNNEDIIIKLDYGENIKIRPDISVTRENQSVEIKIKIDLGRKNERNKKHDTPDYHEADTPQEMVQKYKLHNDISSMVKSCW